MISSTPGFSILDCATSLIRKILGKKIYHQRLRDKNVIQLVIHLLRSLFTINTLSISNIHGFLVLKSEVFAWSNQHKELRYRLPIQSILKSLKWYYENKGQMDLIHAHNVCYSGMAASIWKKNYNTPFVITEHSSLHILGELKSQFYFDMKTAFENAAKVFLVSNYLKRNLLNDYLIDNKSIVLPNFLDKIFDGEINVMPLNNKFKLICVARLVPSKGINVLIQAIKKVQSFHNEIILKIIGDGSELDRLKKLVKDLDVICQVEFLGKLTREEIKAELEDADLFIFPSLFETFGLVVLEALACGVPVLSTKSGGPEELINDSNGILVDVNDEDTIAVQILLVINGKRKFNRKYIQKTTLEKYSCEVVGNTLLQYYKSTISNN